jgi:hypothetical protein
MVNEDDIEYESTGEYTKLRISANTLVPKGAVQEKGIYKSKDGKVTKNIKTIITKSDDEKMVLHSIMYMLGVKDSHGNFITKAKVLEDACTDFMLNGNKVIKHTHEGKQVDASVQQLYIVPENHPLWNESKYVGAIANTIQFNDVELYKYYKENDWETSIEGEAEEYVIPVEKSNMFKKMYDIIINELKLRGVLPMGDIELKKEEAIVDETKPKDEVIIEEEVKKEIDPMIVEYVTSIVSELTSKYDAKFDELKAMIEQSTPKEDEAVIELKKEVLELRKEIAKTSQVDDIKPVKKVKGLLG